MDIDRPRLLSVSEAATELNASEAYVRRLLLRHRLYGIKVGRVWAIFPNDLERRAFLSVVGRGTAAAVIGSLLDLAIASVILFGLLVFYEVPFSPGLALLPLVLILLVVCTLGFGQLVAALNVNYRDIKHALPFFVQIWMFASPVVYPMSMVPERYHWLVSLNPIVGIIETTRALIAGRPVPWEWLGVSCVVTVVMLILSLWYFQRTARRFADVI